MNRIRLIIIALFVSIAASAVPVDSVLASIGRNNPTLRSLTAQAEADMLERSSANTLAPTSVEYSPFFRKGANGVASSELIVSQEFDFPTLYGVRRKANQLQIEAAAKCLATARRETLYQGLLLCLELVRTRQLADVLRERLESAELMGHLFEKRAKAGDATQIDLNKVRLEKIDVEAAMIENEATALRIEREIIALNGGIEMDLDRLIYPTFSLDIESPETFRLLVENDGRVSEANAMEIVAARQLSVGRQRWLPSITLGYRRNTELREASNGVLFGLSLPLFSNSVNVKAAKAGVVASRLAAESARIEATGELEATIAEYQRLRKLVALADPELVRDTFRLLRRSVELGGMTSIEYYLEADGLNRRLQDYIENEYKLHLLEASLAKNQLW